MSHSSLYNNIVYALTEEIAKSIKGLEGPVQFKKLLKYAYDKPITDLTRTQVLHLEKQLKINLVINKVASLNRYTRTVNLTYNQETKLYGNKQDDINYKLLHRKYKTDRNLTFYRKEEGQIVFYDGDKEWVDADFDNALLKKDEDNIYFNVQDEDLKTAYTTFMSNVRHLNYIADISLKDFNYSYKFLALDVFHSYAKVFQFDEMSDTEASWINNTKRCGLMYCEPVMGEMNYYDVNSQYPSIMSLKKYGMPMGGTTFETLKQNPAKFWSFGIYRAIISNVDRRLFLHNPKNHYTHDEIKRAIELGYNVQLIQDGEPNAMLYKKRVPAEQLFKPFVDKLYKHKNSINKETNKKNDLVKKVLNMLAGALAEKDRTVKRDEELEVDYRNLTITFDKSNNGEYIETVSETYKRPHARVYPFITSYGRTMISRIIEPFVEEVYRIHTDGFLTTKDGLQTSVEIGELKLEKSGYYDIVHLNKVLYYENEEGMEKDMDKF